jgi:hypothetical protein
MTERKRESSWARSSGTTVIIYDQTCATENAAAASGSLRDPASVLINELSVKVRRLVACVQLPERVEPLETEFTQAHHINQESTATSVDYPNYGVLSLVSVITVEYGTKKRPKVAGIVSLSWARFPSPNPQPRSGSKARWNHCGWRGGTGVINTSVIG